VLAHEVRLSGLYRFAADSSTAVPEGISGTIRRIYGPLLPEGLAASGQVTATEAESYGLLMAREVVALSERFLVTSQAAARLARVDAGPGLAERIGVLPFATEILRGGGESPAGILGAPPGARVLASFGIVDPIKQPQRLVRCFAELATGQPDLVLALVGPISIELARELRKLGEDLGVAERLFITGRVEPELYLAWLDRVELAVQLRASFSGEASAAVGDCLARGVPMIVTDIGWLGELPGDAATKVSVDVTPSELAEVSRRLLDEASLRRRFRQGALRYAARHTFGAAARALLEVLSQPERAGRSTA
jgi:glycosyltransferase involved in cell wall biosynthesis